MASHTLLGLRAYFMDITTPDSCCVKRTLLRHAEENTGIEVTFMTEISPFNNIVSISWLVTSQSIGCHVMERARLGGETSSFCLPPSSASFIQTCLVKYTVNHLLGSYILLTKVWRVPLACLGSS